MTLYVQPNRGDICELFPKGAVGAELGVFQGKFSRELARRTSPRLMYLIDPWWLEGVAFYSSSPATSAHESHAATVDRMKWWIDREIVKLQVMRSQEALAAFPDEHLDWVYIDSSHDYSETCEELDLCACKVQRSGIISGHDFNTRRHPGVYRALADFLKSRPEYELVYQDNHGQWAIARR